VVNTDGNMILKQWPDSIGQNEDEGWERIVQTKPVVEWIVKKKRGPEGLMSRVRPWEEMPLFSLNQWKQTTRNSTF
jgi:hypothetical protein